MLLTLILSAVMIGTLTVCTVTYWRFWACAAGTDHMELIRQRSGGHVWRWAALAFLSSVLSQLASVALYPAFIVKKYWLPREAAGADAGPPVLFVHGYTHTASAWVFFSAWFRKAGYRDLHAMTYNSLRRSFPEIVRQLEGEVADIVSRRPGRGLVLVGHSLGGLAIREFLNTSPLAENVLAVVTLGAPHQGSTLSGLGMNRLAKTLRYRGDLINDIESHDVPPGVPALSVYSPMDNMVLPLEGLRIRKPGWTEREGEPVCHIGMLYHKPTAHAVLDFLGDSLPAGVKPRGGDRV